MCWLLFYNHSIFHDEFTVCNFCKIRVMRYNDKGLIVLVPKVKKQPVKIISIFRIEITCRLISKDNFG